jgi:hypothetical protein
LESISTFVTHYSGITAYALGIISEDEIRVTDPGCDNSDEEFIVFEGAEFDVFNLPFAFFVRTSGYNSSGGSCGGRHDRLNHRT